MLTRAAPALWSMALLAAAAVAQAQAGAPEPAAEAPGPLPLSLTFDAPPECPSAADVHAELARIAHARPGHVLEPLRADVAVRVERKRYLLHVVTDHQGQRGERELDAKDCPTLVRSLTLVLALAFGPGVELAEPPPSDSSASEVPPAPPEKVVPTSPPPAPPEPPEPPRVRRARQVHWALLAGAGLYVELAPRPAGALLLGAELASRHVSFDLSLLGLRALASEPARGVEARFDGVGAVLHLCAPVPFGPMVVSPCVGAEGLALRGRASGALRDEDGAVAPWYAASGLLRVGYPREGRFRVSMQGGLSVSLERPRFVIEGLTEVQHVPRLVPQAALMLGFAP